MESSYMGAKMYDPFTSTFGNFLRYRVLPALCSGEYTQGTGRLRRADTNSFCCLGVMCDLRGVTWDNSFGGLGLCAVYAGTGSYDVLPDALAKEWNVSRVLAVRIEVADLLPELKLPRTTPFDTDASAIAASMLNDRGYSFKEIALVLETALDHNLFLTYEEGNDVSLRYADVRRESEPAFA